MKIPLGIVASAIVPEVAPVNTIAPIVTGSAIDGRTLVAGPGGWSGNPTSFTYQWQRGTTNISGATSNTYQLKAADVGNTIRVQVTATNGAGSTSAFSANTSTVASGVWAEGGIKATSGSYTYHRFNSTSTFELQSNSLNRSIEYQIIGGGGGGTSFATDKNNRAVGGGGGGGGDFQSGSFAALPVGDYTVTVGAGGAASTLAFETSGTASQFAGGAYDSGSYGTGGGYGGTGYGGNSNPGVGTGGSGNGGAGENTSSTAYGAGGGGGSSGNGGAGVASTGVGGAGGSGTGMWTGANGGVGTTTHGSGGGGGGYNTGGSGGLAAGAGGGSGGSGSSATANRGGGGGGAGRSGTGGNGASGAVIIRYLA